MSSVSTEQAPQGPLLFPMLGVHCLGYCSWASAILGHPFWLQIATFADGSKIGYEALISTIPLDITLRWLGKPEWADGLTHSSSHIVGIGE